MKSIISAFVLGLILNSCSGAYINQGKEYLYNFNSQITAGSDDYKYFASVYNISGKIRIQKAEATLVTAKLDDLTFAAYNGEFSYPSPDFTAKAYQQLNPLTEPFHVRLDSNNQIESIVLSGAIPEWARNIQRGLASAFQINGDRAATGGETNYELIEKTLHGECPTVHQVMKVADGVQILKQRNHAKCQNRAIYVRSPGTTAKSCVDEDTRDVYNSTGYGHYVVSNFNGEVTLTTVKSGGFLQYAIFGSHGHTQFSWTSTIAQLTDVKSSGFSKIGAPSNSQTFDNLRYVFESKFTADDSLEVPVPYYGHYAEAVTDEAVLKAAADRVYENIQKLADSLETVKVFEDITQFHHVSPFSVIPDVAILHYSHLKSLYSRIKADNKYTTTKLFLDTLVVAGTGPAALLVKDIASTTTDTRVLANLIAPLPNYVHNPTEKLLAQFETLIKPDLPKHNLRIIEFAFASLISRTCNMYDCKKGFVEKYAKIFSDKYDNGATFEEKTVAVQALRNLGRGDALKKLVSIVADKNADRSVRTAAMAGLSNITPEEAKETLLPIYYDRQAHHELRTKAGYTFLTNFYDETIATQMATFLWVDHCKYLKNFMYTFFEGLGHTTRPCLQNQGSHARTVLNMLPDWKVDRTLSANYMRDYYDREFNFGHMTQLSIQKNGDSVLPVTIYGSLNGAIAGYGTNYLSFFVRMEGLGKALADRIMSMTTGQISFDDVKQVFAKIGVQERTSTPLRIELALMLHGRVVAYHAADASTVTTIPVLLKKLQEMKSSYDIELSRLMLLGGVRVEQPTEFGNPVSVISAVTALGNVQIKTNREKSGTSISQTSDWNLQGNFFGLSKLSNHFPAFGTQHAVIASRVFRARLPRKFSFTVDYKALTLNFAAETPTKDDPILAMVHATAGTKVLTDGRTQNGDEGAEILKASCPTCTTYATISKGAEHRGTRQIGLPEVSKFKIFEGIKRGAKYFDCEKPHTRYDTIKRIAKFVSEDNKNAGKLGIVRLLLSLQYARDYLFLSPMTQTCGMKAYYHRDPESKSIFEKVEASFRVKYSPEPNKKLGTKVQFKGALNFKHGGPEPQTRTVDVTGQVLLTGMDKRDIKLRFAAKDESTQKNYVLCIDANTQMKKPVDFLSFEGENEPTFERKITLKWGEDSGSGKDSTCPDNAAYIKATRKSQRSQDQVEEAKANGWPYKHCREQKGSSSWPGSLVPPTHECFQAAIDQTNLRQSNITIEYQVDVEARNRWRKPAVAIGALLLPYWDSEQSAAAGHVHSHVEAPSSDPQYVRGSVEIDVAARKINPSLDIHWHASFGEEHFHNVDLAAIPGPLKVKPVFSRFSPFFYEMFKLGVFGYCAASPQAVITYDNFTYNAAMPECEVLLAADCDDKPRFAVLANKIGGDKIGLTVHLGEHKLEMKDLDTVVVDGKAQPASDTIYVDEDEEKLFKFVKINPTYIAIISEKLSVYIGYTGQYAIVTAGSRYRDTSCGLCGNFDNNPTNEFTGPDNTKVAGAEDLMKAYTVRGGKC
jgi:hypothetical protein